MNQVGLFKILNFQAIIVDKLFHQDAEDIKEAMRLFLNLEGHLPLWYIRPFEKSLSKHFLSLYCLVLRDDNNPLVQDKKRVDLQMLS